METPPIACSLSGADLRVRSAEWDGLLSRSLISARPTPHTPLAEWSFTITGAVDADTTWSWEEFRKLPTETVTKDIHCVTKWTKLDTSWTGVAVSTLLEGIETSADYVIAFSDG